MESDDENQQMYESNEIEMPSEFKAKIESKEINICTMVELISLFRNCDKNEKNEKRNPDYENEVVKMTRDYLDKFNKYGISQNREDIPFHLRRLLQSKKVFTKLEEALIIDIAPANAEEAFSLIPSLKSKIKSDEMNEILNELNKEIIPSY